MSEPTCLSCYCPPHLGRCPAPMCECYLGPIAGDPTTLAALEGYLNDEGNHVGGVWGEYGQVVVDTSDLWHAITGEPREWERTSNYAATFNQMREALDACEGRPSVPSLQELASALAVVFAYNASNATVAPDGSLAFGEGPTSYWRDRAEAVAEAIDAAVKGAA